MKKIKFLIVGIIMILGVQNVQSQISIGADFSGLRPMQDDAEFMFGGVVYGRYGITDNIQLGINIGFYQKSYGSIFGQTIKGSVMPITLSGEYLFMTDNVRPYAGVDLGLYNFMAKFGSESNSEIKFGLAPVAGLQFGINDNIYLNANTKYHLILDPDIDNFWSFNIGVGYRF